jgi:ABC-type antimicrobial peptide transport system permease subunit
MFVNRGMTLALAGVGIGLIATGGLTHLMKSVLFGVSPLDPLTLTIVPVLLILAALIASYIPAQRAARADPKTALLYE